MSGHTAGLVSEELSSIPAGLTLPTTNESPSPEQPGYTCPQATKEQEQEQERMGA